MTMSNTVGHALVQLTILSIVVAYANLTANVSCDATTLLQRKGATQSPCRGSDPSIIEHQNGSDELGGSLSACLNFPYLFECFSTRSCCEGLPTDSKLLCVTDHCGCCTKKQPKFCTMIGKCNGGRNICCEADSSCCGGGVNTICCPHGTVCSDEEPPRCIAPPPPSPPPTTITSTTTTTCEKQQESECSLEKPDCCPDEHCIGFQQDDTKKVCCEKTTGGFDPVFDPTARPARDFMVELSIPEVGGSHGDTTRCMGSLSNNRWILTAAHCFYDWCGTDQCRSLTDYTRLEWPDGQSGVVLQIYGDGEYQFSQVALHPTLDWAVVRLEVTLPVLFETLPCLDYRKSFQQCDEVIVNPLDYGPDLNKHYYLAMLYQYANTLNYQVDHQSPRDDYEVVTPKNPNNFGHQIILGDSGGPVSTPSGYALNEVWGTISGASQTQNAAFVSNLKRMKVGEDGMQWWDRFVRPHFETCP